MLAIAHRNQQVVCAQLRLELAGCDILITEHLEVVPQDGLHVSPYEMSLY